MIYVIGIADGCWRDHPIKIGYTGGFSAESRLAGIQTGNPRKLKILATARGDRETESLIHLVLNYARLNGEWFSPSSLPSEFLSAVEANQLAKFILDTMKSIEDKYHVPDKQRHLSGKAFMGRLSEIERDLIELEREDAKNNLDTLKPEVDISKEICWKVHWDVGDILVKRNLQDAVELTLEQIKSFSLKLPKFSKDSSAIEYSALDILGSKIPKGCYGVQGFIEQELTTTGYFSCGIFSEGMGGIVPGMLVQNFWVDMTTGKVKTKDLPIAVMDPDFGGISITVSAMSLVQFRNGSYSIYP